MDPPGELGFSSLFFWKPAVSKSDIEVAGRPTSDEYSTSHG